MNYKSLYEYEKIDIWGDFKIFRDSAKKNDIFWEYR